MTNQTPQDTLPSALPPRVTLVGYGRWGRNLGRNLAQLGALAGVCEIAPTNRAAAASELPEIPVFSRLDEVPRDSAVAIAAPAAQHAKLVDHFLDLGQHVFVEKPLALNLDDGQRLVAKARAAGLVLMVGHLLHYHPAITRLSELVSTGVLGRLRCLYSHRLNLGRFRREESSLWSFAPHDIAVILRLVAALPDRVIATGGHFLHPTIADTTVTQLSWPNGVQAHIYVSWLHPFKEQRLVVVGEDAMAVFDDRQPLQSKLVLYRHGVQWKDGLPTPVRAEPEPVAIDNTEPLREEMVAFLKALRDPSIVLPSDGAEGVRVLAVLDAAQRSVEQAGYPQTIQLSDAVQNSFFQHPTAVIDDGAVIGDGSSVWHGAHVMSGAVVGRDCSLGKNVFVQSGVRIGDRCKVQNNVSIYDGVVLADDVFCGPSCVFTNVVRPRAHVSRKAEFAATPVGRGATIGANATIVCGNALGAHAFVGAGAVVTHNVPAHALVLGNPARQKGWVCSCGEKLPLDYPGEGVATCARCATGWQTDGHVLKHCGDAS